jgi:hypothetical protein
MSDASLFLAILHQAKLDHDELCCSDCHCMWYDFLNSGICKGDHYDIDAIVWWVVDYISRC